MLHVSNVLCCYFKEEHAIFSDNFASLYTTLKQCTDAPKYKNALSEINLKLTNNMFDNQIDVSVFDFLCHLCNIWLRDHICYDNIDYQQYDEIAIQDDKKKQFLNKYKHAPKVIIKNGINAEFLLINQIVNSLPYQEDGENNTFLVKINEYQNLIDDCNKKANENLDIVIGKILEENPNYTEQIIRLREQWEEQIVYEGEDDGEEREF